MNDHSFRDLSAAGRLRQQAILDDVLAASVRRLHRRRRTRIGLAAAAGVALAVGIPFLRTRDDPRGVVQLSPTTDVDRGHEPDPAPRPPVVDESQGLIVETLTDEMLLAQLDAAGVPYLQTGDGEVRLIGAGHDPWRLTSASHDDR